MASIVEIDTPTVEVTVGMSGPQGPPGSSGGAGLATGVVEETSFGQSSAVGTSGNVARQDHSHGTPANPITAHESASDPHAGYQKESEKGAANGYAGLGANGFVPTAQLASTAADGTKYLRGDQVWASIPSVTAVDWKESVRAATTANITLSGTQTVDGVALIAGDRVLVKDQATGSQNGIYVVAAGAWARATDADAPGEVTAGMATFTSEGALNGNKAWVLITDDPITLDTTPLAFTQMAGSGSTSPADALPGSLVFGGAGAIGTSTDYAREDHNHPTPANPVTAHEAAADPHTGYQREAEKAAANGYASLDASTKVPFAQLPTGAGSSQVAVGDHSHAGFSFVSIAKWGTE
jgi:hypothetical protein